MPIRRVDWAEAEAMVAGPHRPREGDRSTPFEVPDGVASVDFGGVLGEGIELRIRIGCALLEIGQARFVSALSRCDSRLREDDKEV